MSGHVLDDVRELRVLLRGVALKAEGFLSRRFLLLLLLDGAHVVLRKEIFNNCLGTDTSFPNNCYTKSVFCIFFTTRPRRDVKVSCFLSDYKVEEGSILQKTGTQCRLFFPSRTSVSCPSSLALAFAPPSAHPLVKTPLNALAPSTVRRRRLHLWR